MGKKKAVEMPTKKLLAVVSGMSIYSDSIYVVTGKPDESAPTGFQERGISKVPFPGNGIVSPCPWDKNLGVYDTGFFDKSICYKGMSKAEVETEVKRRVENILNPYEDATGRDIHQKNFDFWDTFRVKCYDGRLFYTNDMNDLFDLYIAIQGKVLTPKDEDGNPDFQGSLYCVEDKTTAVDVRKQRMIDKSEITYEFMSMLKGEDSERQKIFDLLLYLDIIHSVEMDPNMVQYIFSNWIEQKNTHIDMYKEARNRFLVDDEENGAQIIKFHRMIKEMIYSGAIQVNSSGMMFRGEDIGSDAISAAIQVVENKDFIQSKADIIDAYTTMKEKQAKM